MLIKKSKIPFKQIVTIGILPSFLKKIIYRLKGYKIGKNVSIGFGSVIIGKSVKLDQNVKIGLITIIRAEQIFIEKHVSIGSFTVIDSGKIRIGEDSKINEQVIIGGMKTPQSELNMGKRAVIMEYSFINTTMPITIGDDSGIGGHCLLFTHGSWLNELEGFPVTFAPITIGKSVWLPWRVFVMPGVTIGDKVVVGANSLLTKSVPGNCLVAGSPAKIIKENYAAQLSTQEKEKIFERFVNDFISHLQYNGIQVNKTTNENFTLIQGQSQNRSFKMFVCQNEMMKQVEKGDLLTVMNVADDKDIFPEKVNSGQMFIDIFNKRRRGSSNIGEEFAKFITRYGIRLERI